MTPTALQIFATIFALFALSRVILRLKEHQLTIRESLFWGLIWVGTIIVLWIPSTAFLISRTMGLNTREPIDTLVYMATVIMFYLINRMHVKHEKLEQEFTKLVRSLSLLRAKAKRK